MSFISQLLLGKDRNSNVTFFISPPTSTEQSFQFSITTPGTPVTVPIPDWAKEVKFTSDPGSSLWVRFDGAATTPTTAVVTANTSELNPLGRLIPKDATEISFDSKALCDVQVVFYPSNQRLLNAL
jgi:hypothetical protein